MYHAMRPCAFLFYQGDDHEEHSQLPLHIPADFPDKSWQSRLKDARLARNVADYDPYPLKGGGWKKQALTLDSDSEQLVVQARAYLKSNGCKIR
jgi:hypothetical protein